MTYDAVIRDVPARRLLIRPLQTNLGIAANGRNGRGADENSFPRIGRVALPDFIHSLRNPCSPSVSRNAWMELVTNARCVSFGPAWALKFFL